MLPYQLPESAGKLNAGTRDAIFSLKDDQLDAETGIGWGLQRSLLVRHSWYDRAIVGGSDRLMMYAALGRQKQAAEWSKMSQDWAADYLTWADRFQSAVKGKLGFLENTVYTMWHGSLSNRRYIDRHQMVYQLGYNPVTDLALSDQGVWRWSSDKPELHKAVKENFTNRHENGRLARGGKKSNGSWTIYLEV